MNALQPDMIVELLTRFAIDLVAVVILAYAMYYRRYRDKTMVTAATIFNVFAFAVLVVLSTVEFGVVAGFGLFALLALFTLRSEPITKIEISYFFGSVSIAVITAVFGTSIPFVIFITVLALLGAYVFDHPKILKSTRSLKIVLDTIDREALADPVMMRSKLGARLGGVEVLSYRVNVIDYIDDMVQLDVSYRQH
jgi:Domain of unknown function (DUF4956)